VYGFISAGNHPWGSASVVVSLALGGAGLAAFILRERYASAPLIPHGFLRNGTRVSANVANMIFAAVFFTLFFLLTLYMQEVLHYSALRTGVVYLPFGLVIGVGIGLSSAVITKVGMKSILITGASFVAVGLALMSRITVHGSYLGQILPAEVVIAFGSGLSFAAFGNASMHEVSGQDASLAAGVQSTFQQVGGAVGLAVLATMALRSSNSAIAHGIAFPVASTHGAVLAFRTSAVVAAVAALVVTLSPIAKPARSPKDEIPVIDELAANTP
jgi:predicted MFS family arabinose efflux permease